MYKESILDLQQKFDNISEKGYIKGIYNNFASVGRTFENELHLSRNPFSVPDYQGIEIKTRRTTSKSRITLFTAVPDGENLFEVERLRDNYGYPYKKDRRYKVLYFDAFGDKLTYGGVKYQYKLEINRKEQKVFLCVYDRDSFLLEKTVYWSFDYLKVKLFNKLKVLAIVDATVNNIDGWNYFNYYKINYYILRGFEEFIELLENGYLRITFKVGIYLDEKNYGKIYDHGCSFSILEQDILKLFYKYDYNNNSVYKT